jgi:hypothetical protein
MVHCEYKELFKHLLPAAEMCRKYADSACGETQSFINFYHMHFCWMNGHLYLTLSLYVIMLFFIFKYTSIVVENYVIECIQ